MSGSKKTDKIEVSYWKKPSGKNSSLKVPSDKANAILDFWRKSSKKTGMANESEDIEVKEKKFKDEVDLLESKKLQKKVVRTEETQQSLSPSSKDVESVDGVEKLDKKSAETSPKKLLGVATEKPIKISPKKSPGKSKSISGSLDGTRTKRKIHQFFEPPNKKIAYQKIESVAGTSSSSNQDGPSDTLSIDVVDPVNWKNIVKQDLDLDYGIVFQKSMADKIFQQLEKQTEYYSGDLAKIRVFGKWHNIPRKQVAYGDDGLSYKFSGNCLPAQKWTPFLSSIRNVVEKLTGFSFNFVLINRYKDGCDTIGEHRDDEKDLVANHPIASLSLGQQRDFVLRHALARNKASNGQHPPSFTVALEHGSLLVMKPPTNKHWYHSLPVRKGACNARINLTFRHMLVK